MTVENASKELRDIMEGGAKHTKMVADYKELQRIVGSEGASDRFAARMVELLK
jgi:lipid-A-disaccharide synthase